MRALNFGSLNIDMVYSVDHTVRPGETTASSSLKYFCGGKGLNQSIALARAGVEVFHAGCIGENGDMLLEKLHENSVNTDLVVKRDMPNGHAIIQVDKDGQNSILLFGGANKSIDDKYIERVLADFKHGDRLFLQNEINGIDRIISFASEKGIEIVFNPSPFDKEILSFPLEKISWFVVNETEAKELTGETDPNKILDIFSKKYPSANILLTLGGDGSVCKSGKKIYRQQIFKVPVIDTTAAGDTFLGYFFAILDSCGIGKALKYAAAAASIAVSKNGASSSVPSIDEVEQFLGSVELPH